MAVHTCRWETVSSHVEMPSQFPQSLRTDSSSTCSLLRTRSSLIPKWYVNLGSLCVGEHIFIVCSLFRKVMIWRTPLRHLIVQHLLLGSRELWTREMMFDRKRNPSAFKPWTSFPTSDRDGHSWSMHVTLKWPMRCSMMGTRGGCIVHDMMNKLGSTGWKQIHFVIFSSLNLTTHAINMIMEEGCVANLFFSFSGWYHWWLKLHSWRQFAHMFAIIPFLLSHTRLALGCKSGRKSNYRFERFWLDLHFASCVTSPVAWNLLASPSPWLGLAAAAVSIMQPVSAYRCSGSK